MITGKLITYSGIIGLNVIYYWSYSFLKVILTCSFLLWLPSKPFFSVQLSSAKYTHIVVPSIHPSPDLFHLPTLKLCSLWVITPRPLLPTASRNYHSTSVSMNMLTSLGTSCKWNHAIFVLLWLATLLSIVSSRVIHVSEFPSFISFNHIPLYVCMYHVLSTYLLLNNSVASNFWLLCIMLLWIWWHKYIFKTLLSNSQMWNLWVIWEFYF